MAGFPEDEQAWVRSVVSSLAPGAPPDKQGLASIGAQWGLGIYLEAKASLKLISGEYISVRALDRAIMLCSLNQNGLPVDGEGNLPRMVVAAALVAIEMARQSDPEVDWIADPETRGY